MAEPAPENSGDNSGLAACLICGREMTPEADCGGDCAWCMAALGDPRALKYVKTHPETEAVGV